MPASRLSRRIIARLVQAEVCEHDPHYCDDLRIARLTVSYAASGEAKLCTPHVLASYMVLGLHPDKVWSKIVAQRKAEIGRDYPLYFDENDNWRVDSSAGESCVPKKPPQSVKLWSEKTNAARALNSRRAEVQVLREPTTRLPMAA